MCITKGIIVLINSIIILYFISVFIACNYSTIFEKINFYFSWHFRCFVLWILEVHKFGRGLKFATPFGFICLDKQILNQVQEKVKFCDKFFCEFFYHKKAKKSSLFLKKKFGGFLPQINRGIMRLWDFSFWELAV